METIKEWLDDNPTWKRVGIFLLVAGVLFGAWILFLWLVKEPPLDTTSAMIMIWISFAVAIFTLFPGLLNKIKRIKIKDFDLELQESVTKATSIDYLSISEGPDYHISRKSDFSDFVEIFLRARKKTDKPILLIVNVRNGSYISIPALYIYLYFLDLHNSNVICLFVSSNTRSDSPREFNKEDVIGAANGKKVLTSLLDRFPNLIRSITHAEFTEDINLFNRERLKNHFRILYEKMSGEFRNNEYLTEENIRNYFSGNINNEFISYDTSQEDEKTILNAIIKGKEYLNILRGNKLYSVIPLEEITNDISKKVLQDILKNGDK
jgi:hypothetical protein